MEAVQKVAFSNHKVVLSCLTHVLLWFLGSLHFSSHCLKPATVQVFIYFWLDQLQIQKNRIMNERKSRPNEHWRALFIGAFCCWVFSCYGTANGRVVKQDD